MDVKKFHEQAIYKKQSLRLLNKYTFITKPVAAWKLMNLGVPKQHTTFWKKITVNKLFAIFKSLTVKF